MAIKDLYGNLTVFEAALKRIKNAFSKGLPVILSISGGKDSIVMAGLTYTLIQRNEIDAKNLIVQFIDEEAIFDDVERIVLDWRKKFMLAGAKFEWYCVQVKHFNCLNSLSDDETFITWDANHKNNWVRPMPDFAIKSHPLLKPRIDSYQTFLPRINKGAIALIGVRASESIMRRQNMSVLLTNKNNDGGLNGDNSIFPIYDWQDDDVWLYIQENKLDFPETYMYLYQTGSKRKDMRLSQFFSIDTAKSLVKMSEYHPKLMERIVRREPNAYLASMYWDTEMFRRTSKTAKEKKEEEAIDYKSKVMEMFKNPDDYFFNKGAKQSAYNLKRLVVKEGSIMSDKHWRETYNILVAGDPKGRAYRGLQTGIRSDYALLAKKQKGVKR